MRVERARLICLSLTLKFWNYTGSNILADQWSVITYLQEEPNEGWKGKAAGSLHWDWDTSQCEQSAIFHWHVHPYSIIDYLKPKKPPHKRRERAVSVVCHYCCYHLTTKPFEVRSVFNFLIIYKLSNVIIIPQLFFLFTLLNENRPLYNPDYFILQYFFHTFLWLKIDLIYSAFFNTFNFSKQYLPSATAPYSLYSQSEIVLLFNIITFRALLTNIKYQTFQSSLSSLLVSLLLDS